MDGYEILNINDFEKLDVPQIEYTVTLADIGDKSFLVFKYDYLNVIIDNKLFTLQMNDRNPVRNGNTVLYVNDGKLWYGTD